MNRRFQAFAMVTMIVGLFTRAAHAAEGITVPAATDKWTEGARGKTVKFNWEGGCVAYTVETRRRDNKAVIYFTNHGVAATNPETFSIGIVPDPGGASGTDIGVTVKVV